MPKQPPPADPDPELVAELRALLAAHREDIDARSRDPHIAALEALAAELVEEELEPYAKVLPPKPLEALREEAIAWVLLGPLREKLERLLPPSTLGSHVRRKDGEPVADEKPSSEKAGGRGK